MSYFCKSLFNIFSIPSSNAFKVPSLKLRGMVLAQMKSVPFFPAKESLLRAGRAKHVKNVD